MTARIALRAAVAMVAMAIATFCAAEEWERRSLSAPSLTVKTFESDESGLRYVRLMITGIQPGWRVEVRYGSGARLVFDESNILAWQIRQLASGHLVDVQLPRGETIAADGNQQGIRVLPVEMTYPAPARPEQMIQGSDVHPLPPDGGKLGALVGTFGRLELLSAGGGLVKLCTAFRVRQGWWLTAAHCVYRDSQSRDDPIVARMRLQLHAYAGAAEVDAPLSARPVAAGLRASSLPPSDAYLDSEDLDYALLEVPQDSGGAVLALENSPAAIRPGTELQLLQYWIGQIPPLPGKAYSTGASCSVYQRVGLDDPSRPELCPASIQHGCSSQEGASGGAILGRPDAQPLAIHYGAGRAGRFNCALPLKTVRADLCARTPEVARKVTVCD